MHFLSILQLVSLLGGVALFLFGMTLMGDGLTKVSGSRLEPILFRLSGTPLKALLLGTGVTAVIQSSCATSVMAVGFVNAGMMTVRQSINVILGSILGTSITGWVLCLSYIEGSGSLSSILSTATLTAIVAVAGIMLHRSKSTSRQHIGDILMGFAILMFGMHTMSASVSTLGDQPWFTHIMSTMSNPLLGILVGAAFTAILQSASAAVGIVQALSVTGAMSFGTVLPLLMGINIGASVPVLLSAIGASVRGRRAALVYLVVSVLGVLGCASIFYTANAVFQFPFMTAVMNPFSTAFVNSVFRLVHLVLLAPFTDAVEAIVTRLVPDRGEEACEPVLQLEERFLDRPTLALEQSRTAMNDMALYARRSIDLANSLLKTYTDEGFEKVRDLETLVDQYEDRIGTYLMKMSGQKLTALQSAQSAKYLHTLSDFERISDHARNIAESSAELHTKQLVFSESTAHDLSVLLQAVSEIVRTTTEAYRTDNLRLARYVEPLEEAIDVLTDEMKMRQVERLRHRQGNITTNFVFNDLITNYERISDHCSNIALAMLRLEQGDFETHDYEEQILREREPGFEQVFTEFRKKYTLAA